MLKDIERNTLPYILINEHVVQRIIKRLTVEKILPHYIVGEINFNGPNNHIIIDIKDVKFDKDLSDVSEDSVAIRIDCSFINKKLDLNDFNFNKIKSIISQRSSNNSKKNIYNILCLLYEFDNEFCFDFYYVQDEIIISPNNFGDVETSTQRLNILDCSDIFESRSLYQIFLFLKEYSDNKYINIIASLGKRRYKLYIHITDRKLMYNTKLFTLEPSSLIGSFGLVDTSDPCDSLIQNLSESSSELMSLNLQIENLNKDIPKIVNKEVSNVIEKYIKEFMEEQNKSAKTDSHIQNFVKRDKIVKEKSLSKVDNGKSPVKLSPKSVQKKKSLAKEPSSPLFAKSSHYISEKNISSNIASSSIQNYENVDVIKKDVQPVIMSPNKDLQKKYDIDKESPKKKISMFPMNDNTKSKYSSPKKSLISTVPNPLTSRDDYIKTHYNGPNISGSPKSQESTATNDETTAGTSKLLNLLGLA